MKIYEKGMISKFPLNNLNLYADDNNDIKET